MSSSAEILMQELTEAVGHLPPDSNQAWAKWVPRLSGLMNEQLLCKAIRLGDWAWAEFLLPHADTTRRRSHPFWTAIAHDRQEFLDWLLDHKAGDPVRDSGTWLRCAADRQRFHLLQHLLHRLEPQADWPTIALEIVEMAYPESTALIWPWVDQTVVWDHLKAKENDAALDALGSYLTREQRQALLADWSPERLPQLAVQERGQQREAHLQESESASNRRRPRS